MTENQITRDAATRDPLRTSLTSEQFQEAVRFALRDFMETARCPYRSAPSRNFLTTGRVYSLVSKRLYANAGAQPGSLSLEAALAMDRCANISTSNVLAEADWQWETGLEAMGLF